MPSFIRRSNVSSSSADRPLELDVQMESPPLIMYGAPDVSSGALASGLLKMTVFEHAIQTNSVNLKFMRVLHTKNPVRESCPNCRAIVDVLESWNFSSSTFSFSHGTHTWPFSFIIPGHFPQTTESPFVNIRYFLLATVTSDVSANSNVKLEHTLNIKRSIILNTDKVAQRLFPPTSLVALLEMPPVIHALSCIPIQFQLTGCRPQNTKYSWHLSKVSWRIEEQIKAQINPCTEHEGSRKPHVYRETRLLGNDEHRTGWKVDGDRILFEIPVSTSLLSKPICDVTLDGQYSLSIAHQLIFETIVVEEINARPVNSNARILRMKVNLPLTERGGLGVSWDEECPPMFSSVGPSPPPYEHAIQMPPV
ncbi:endocytosis regulator [Schizosaccharomyces cryophilus OY26]|uniref:Endocytosis regulator n=1 Tax=Schizosaccharomyces cryophilus (strain OY26 / ATCC MYA-4695 / CBS 11777 / NBRC 106824 / NRRL Y48691) TaxID=653667 RepID=S9W0H5_SCHCR|nr:endocytosis regulator [Schizosaccharomyces cryophilus OY26]EPY51560.1 endocytosis regulator [Schizosaccharomyces cryophilus OY26]